MLKVSEAGRVYPPDHSRDMAHTRIALLTRQGRLLLVPAKEIPELARGKRQQIN